MTADSPLATLAPTDSGFAPANGLQLYWESYGSGGTPLILLHGGYGTTRMLGDLLNGLAGDRRVIVVDQRGHGRTADVDRPLTYEDLGDDISALITYLDLGPSDLVGYSLGAGAALRCTIQHPHQVRRLVVVSTTFSRSGWYPEVRDQMDQMGRSLFPMLRQSPLYAAYAAVAPDVGHFEVLMDKMGDLLRTDHDWSADLQDLSTPTLLVFGDADSMPPAYASEFFARLGGGLRDGGWDGSGRSPNQLAILPGATHHDIIASPLLEPAVRDFLR